MLCVLNDHQAYRVLMRHAEVIADATLARLPDGISESAREEIHEGIVRLLTKGKDHWLLVQLSDSDLRAIDPTAKAAKDYHIRLGFALDGSVEIELSRGVKI